SRNLSRIGDPIRTACERTGGHYERGLRPSRDRVRSRGRLEANENAGTMGREFCGADRVFKGERRTGIAMGERIVRGRNRLGGMALPRSDAGVRLRSANRIAQAHLFLETDSARAATRICEIADLFAARRDWPPLLDARYWMLDFRITKHPESRKNRPLPSAQASRIIRPDAGSLIRSRIRFIKAKSMKRGSSSSRFDWLTKTGCTLRRFYFRRDEAEFPTASQTVCISRIFWDSRAADRVPNLLGALRPLNNWANIKDQHELLSTGEAPAPWAGSVSTTGRPRAFSRSARADPETKNTLATHRSIFWKWRRPKETGDAIAQRAAATAAAAAAA